MPVICQKTVAPTAYTYRNPRAKAPVIDPGAEAPFLISGGEGSTLRATMSHLTERGGPAMIEKMF